MDQNSLKRIRQKAEDYKKHSKAAQRQEPTDESLLERIRQKAEEQEILKKRNLDWQDKIQAIQETYGLSEQEIATILQEVEEEEQKAPALSPVPRPKLFKKIRSLFFSPKGRIGRGTFLAAIVAVFVFQGLCGGLSVRAPFPFVLLAFVGFYSQIVLCIKRFHDLNKSGVFSLLTLIPFLNFFVALYLLFAKGTEGANAFGQEESKTHH